MRKCELAVPLAALLCGVLTVAAAAQGTVVAPADPGPSLGNPLWAIALTDLPETRARPLFSPSRLPPTAPVLAALTSAPAIPAPRPKAGPDHPLLTLVGTIVSRSVEIGLFVDETSHDVIRLKAGETRDGWTLSSVVGRSAFFQKDGHPAATLVLPASGAEGGTAPRHTAPPVIAPVVGVAPANASEPTNNPAGTKGGARRPPKEG
jgi:hypothetical protein